MSFIQFGTDDSVISSELITAPLWSGNVTALTASYSSSVQQTSVSGKYYLSVYNMFFGTSGSEVQYSLTYGHVSGSGSTLFNGNVNEKSPTRDIYGQYRNVAYGDEGALFNFGGNNGISKDIYAININRSRYKESVNPGSWNLVLSNNSDSISLTDDSKDSSITNFLAGNRVYNIVSGSSGNSYNSSSIQTASGSYGLFFPDMGLMILNPRALALDYADKGIGIIVDETSADTYSEGYNTNVNYLYTAISAGAMFSGRSQETISARYFFVNVKSSQYNYTTNPSIIDSNGNILHSSLIDNPQVYPTTIGMYNDAGELLAVAKLSKPLPKDFTKQITCRVKLEF
jgi:hypothetical protein